MSYNNIIFAFKTQKFFLRLIELSVKAIREGSKLLQIYLHL